MPLLLAHKYCHLKLLKILGRAGNLVGPSMGAEATGDVTSSGPVKLADLQRILSNLGSAGTTVLLLGSSLDLELLLSVRINCDVMVCF